MREALRQLLDDFDAITAEHGEVCDTDVREAMWVSIHHLFIAPKPGYRMPTTFEMATADGDEVVARALGKFLSDPAVVEVAHSSRTAEERLAMFEHDSVLSDNGSSYNMIFGKS